MAKEGLAIVGPTACGKTRRAVEAARILNGEILSADSRQVYRGMDIGTGKDLEEYGEVPYHLIDICNAGEQFNLHRYLNAFRLALDDVRSRHKCPVICGGSGMYVENALRGIILPEVPENSELRADLAGKSLSELTRILEGMKRLHNVTDVDTCSRAIRAIEIQDYYQKHPDEAAMAYADKAMPLNFAVIGLAIPRDDRRNRISERLRNRLDDGMIEEIRGLIASGVTPEALTYYGLEYKYVTLYVTGQIDYDTMYRQLEIAIHQFAKRQMTWFRGMETRGTKITWLPYDLPAEEFQEAIRNAMA